MNLKPWCFFGNPLQACRGVMRRSSSIICRPGEVSKNKRCSSIPNSRRPDPSVRLAMIALRAHCLTLRYSNLPTNPVCFGPSTSDVGPKVGSPSVSRPLLLFIRTQTTIAFLFYCCSPSLSYRRTKPASALYPVLWKRSWPREGCAWHRRCCAWGQRSSDGSPWPDFV